ncbi:MAG: Hsp70 family protein [Aestuariivita sp.]|nr:Hsp70 family protein [Aestuariivita sp.]
MNEPDVVIEIDLRTINSEVAIIENDQPVSVRKGDETILPSCVGLDDAGNITVGQQERNQSVAAPDKTIPSIKQLTGSNQTVNTGGTNDMPQKISTCTPATLHKYTEDILGHPVSKTAITVPGYFTDVQRPTTRDTVEIAGFEIVRIINEPTATALTYESLSDEPRKILVYDLGGETFIVSVMRIEDGIVEVLSSTGNNSLGDDLRIPSSVPRRP